MELHVRFGVGTQCVDRRTMQTPGAVIGISFAEVAHVVGLVVSPFVFACGCGSPARCTVVVSDSGDGNRVEAFGGADVFFPRPVCGSQPPPRRPRLFPPPSRPRVQRLWWLQATASFFSFRPPQPRLVFATSIPLARAVRPSRRRRRSRIRCLQRGLSVEVITLDAADSPAGGDANNAFRVVEGSDRARDMGTVAGLRRAARLL